MRPYFIFIFSLLLITCKRDENQNPPPEPEPGEPQLVDVFPNLRFVSPVEVATAPDNRNRLFVVQQGGQIEVFNAQEGTNSKTTFLNISGRLVSGGETGLLGLAFHPNYTANGFFYVYYTRNNPGLESVVSRFRVSNNNINQADANSEEILLTFAQPFDNHNGGCIKFGKDGYLYIASGDGGRSGDPQNNAQNLTNLLGKILRIDVDNPQSPLKYGIPNDNPFKNNNLRRREEIYAYGLRNPWKMSFDRQTGALWAADVGQGAIEEIDIIESGKNYGWRIREGNACYNPSSDCSSDGLTAPIYTYSQSNGDRSITGGYVYRGSFRQAWQGKYIYGDYVSGRIWLLTYENNRATNQLLWNIDNISSFGEDQAGELYVCIYDNIEGRLLKIK
ncbi:MAG: PQQ-dependent sugar dehydrogenase [Microscillaceae bacterium]|jgi:glucose/arabinose dehydrogenase|nr:PQQ-dependent sugar dehydrogenase [Microscillaceae bacterium]